MAKFLIFENNKNKTALLNISIKSLLLEFRHVEFLICTPSMQNSM